MNLINHEVSGGSKQTSNFNKTDASATGGPLTHYHILELVAKSMYDGNN